ncbi:MAG: hypothetical protein OXD43_13035 [Bacteroidetes bacterium]|nr:hypothetical protein [Bacteroidota bacterium]
MQVHIHDRDALLAVSPTALSAYAHAAGWKRHEAYRVHSDIYVGDDRPEVIVPRTERLGDYASVVAELIKVFAHVGGQDETSVYRSLVTADRDIIRVQAGESQDGSVPLNKGVDLIGGTHDMLLAAACSLGGLKTVYRAGANRSATDLLAGIRLGQTDQGSFIVTLLTPVVPPPIQLSLPGVSDQDAPPERRLTVRLMKALVAACLAVERTTVGNGDAFKEAVESGVSANLCEALARIIRSFPTLDVSVSWARTRPVTVPQQNAVRFGGTDAPVLQEAARSFREHAPQPDVRLHGHVRLLTRGEGAEDGTIRLNTFVDQKSQSVTALLERRDYERAIQAHKDKAMVILSGDLERMGQRWRLLNSHLEGVLSNE